MGWPFSGKDGIAEKIFLQHFTEKGESSLRFLCEGKLSRMCLLSEYRNLPPIEEMPVDKKIELNLYVAEMFPEKTTEEKIECAKIIYTIGTLL